MSNYMSERISTFIKGKRFDLNTNLSNDYELKKQITIPEFYKYMNVELITENHYEILKIQLKKDSSSEKQFVKLIKNGNWESSIVNIDDGKTSTGCNIMDFEFTNDIQK